MNCTIRKTKNASVARNLPATSGTSVSTSSSLRNITYCGMSRTWYGSSRVPIISVNSRFRPANLILAKA